MKKNNSMKKVFESKPFLIIVSLLLSLTIWLYVTSVEAEEFKQTFRGVRLEIVGDEQLRESKNLIITDLDTNTVTIEVSGPRRIVGSLDTSDIVAQIDVSKLSRAAYTSQQYSIYFPNGTDTSNLQVSKRTPETVSFMVSNENKKVIPVYGGFEGEVAEGFSAEKPVFEPAVITISGAEAYIRDIDHAWVSFGKDMEISSSYSVESGFTLIDVEGNKCSTSGIAFSNESVTANLTLLENKDVMLSVDLVEGAGATSNNTKVTIEPELVTLAGDSAILEGMNKIVLGTIDLTDFSSTFTETYTIALDNELKNLTGVSEAKVMVEVIGLTTGSFKVKNISAVNATDGINYSIISESVDVIIRGSEETLSQIKSENIRAVVDLADYKDSTGSFMVPAKIYVDGYTNVGAIGDVVISVDIGK